MINVQATAGASMRDIDALARIRDISGGALAEVRSLLASLRATGDVVVAGTRSKDDLVAAMRAVLTGFEDVGLKIDARFPAAPDSERLVRIESALVQFIHYRILGEALTNVVRHQGPDSHVLLVTEVDFPENVLRIRIESWAGSQEFSVAPGVGSGEGLTGLRDRVHGIGGTLSWWADGAGGSRSEHFVVEAVMPVVMKPKQDASRWRPRMMKEKCRGR